MVHFFVLILTALTPVSFTVTHFTQFPLVGDNFNNWHWQNLIILVHVEYSCFWWLVLILVDLCRNQLHPFYTTLPSYFNSGFKLITILFLIYTKVKFINVCFRFVFSLISNNSRSDWSCSAATLEVNGMFGTEHIQQTFFYDNCRKVLTAPSKYSYSCGRVTLKTENSSLSFKQFQVRNFLTFSILTAFLSLLRMSLTAIFVILQNLFFKCQLPNAIWLPSIKLSSWPETMEAEINWCVS